VTEIYIEIEDLFKFDSLEACKGKKAIAGWLAQPHCKPIPCTDYRDLPV
jgi:hypothetical protein